MNTYGNSAFPMNTYSNYPTGAEFDPMAPWNRVETIDVHLCKDCAWIEVKEEGDRCKECQAVEDGMCCSCFEMPIQNKDSDICAACATDAAMYSMEKH